jgi:small-conductance mechanosensitive channel
MQEIFSVLKPFAGPVGMIAAVLLLMLLNAWIFNKFKKLQSSANVIKRSIGAFIILFGLVGFVLTLPVDKTTKEQILAFLGIIISAGIALSSTTILGNIIAGLMNNSMKRFRNGDLVKINDLMGRVTKKDIFHTEIQLQDSNILTIPNLYIATNPVKLTRKTDTIIYSSVSLGYDVPRVLVENTLKAAAVSAGLKDPYVYITNLGDFSVSYKVHGFLEESNRYFSASSELNGQVMDHLHQAGIEIVSPGFVYQRRVGDQVVIPKPEPPVDTDSDERTPEELIFDKAQAAEKIEEKIDYLKKLEQRKEEMQQRMKKSETKEDKERLESILKNIDERKKQLKENIDKQKKENSDEPD